MMTCPPNPLRPYAAAVGDILNSLTDAIYISCTVGSGLLLETNDELYLLEHSNKCIRRAYYFEKGKILYTDTRNLTNKDYDRILSKVEDTVGMSIDELTHGRIFYKNQQ